MHFNIKNFVVFCAFFSLSIVILKIFLQKFYKFFSFSGKFCGFF